MMMSPEQLPRSRSRHEWSGRDEERREERGRQGRREDAGADSVRKMQDVPPSSIRPPTLPSARKDAQTAPHFITEKNLYSGL